jgi:uncharacterized membrane protein
MSAAHSRHDLLELFDSRRLASVDRVRGLVMVLMALDHVRWFFSDADFSPTDLAHTSVALFLTRWVTHFCAPAFVFLAGTGAFLSATRGTTRPELARYLVTRGLWLIFLEATVVHVAWSFQFDLDRQYLGVLWAIGGSMIAMAGLIFLPLQVVGLAGVALIAGHNLADGLDLDSFKDGAGHLSALGWLANVLHVSRPPISYPLIPWLGVMMAGYAFGPVLLLPRADSLRVAAVGGAVLAVAFVLLRAANGYGDPTPWAVQPEPVFSTLSFLNTKKYPPSLLYLLMTLGPTLLALAWPSGHTGPISRLLVAFGRVPLFFYLLHLYLIHGLALLVAWAQGLEVAAFLAPFMDFPKDWGFGLPAVYGIWAAVVAMLYPLCRWYSRVKARHHGSWWVGYL